MFLTQEATDDIAHTWSWRNRISADLHASTRANALFIIEYIRKFHPQMLVVLFSDHGSNQEIWENEWLDHGLPLGHNKGFMILIHDSFKSKKKLSGFQELDTSNLWSGITMSLKNVNLPKYHQRIPEPRFSNDQVEMIQIYRSREKQIQNVLGLSSLQSPASRYIPLI